MYLHEMVSRADFGVDIDVGRDHAGRRPDILVERQGASFFLEATVALGDGAVDPTERARAEQLYAAIERVNNRNFLLHTELRKVGRSTPARKLIADPLDRWLAGLDPDDLRRQAEAGEPAPAITINEQGWIVQIEATGLKPELRGDASAGVIGSRMEGFATDADGEDVVAKLDDIRPLTNVLLKKAGHDYELNDRPFVIAVLCAGDFVDDHDIAQALFGRLEYRISMDSDRSVGRYVPGDYRTDAPAPATDQSRRFCTARNVTPGAIAAVEPRLWLNPDASRPINLNALPWASWEIATGGQLIEHPATRTAADLFGLAVSPRRVGHPGDGWLGGRGLSVGVDGCSARAIRQGLGCVLGLSRRSRRRPSRRAWFG